MARYTASLVAQNTNAYVFTVHKPRNGSDCCTFTVGVYGTFGTGTVTINLSPDNGVTLLPLAPINGSSPSITANGCYTFKVGNGDTNSTAPDIYVAIGAATNPVLSVVAYDNN
jgi:hypothetical protein